MTDQLAFPLIGLPPSLMFHGIFAEVLGTVLNRQAVELERSNSIHARLTSVALEGGSFNELITTVSDLVHRPAAILDVQGNHLAATADVPEDPEAPRTGCTIKIGDQVHGKVVIWADEDAELLPHELKTMEHAATVAATAIAQERAVVSSEQRHRTLLLMQLVTRRTADRAEIARWATAMGWDMDLERAVVLVELRDANGPVPVAGQPLEEQFVHAMKSAAGSNTIVWGLRSGLALLVEPKPSLRDRCTEVHRVLGRARRGLKVMVAAGTVAADFSDLSRSWQDAQSTLALGRELAGDDFVLEHDELGVFRLLSHLPSTELRRQRDDMLGSLLEYDESHSGSLLNTLDFFLRCDRNRVLAAQELFIHYNTLRYRLTQIDRFTGLSADPARRLNLELALCAHRLLRGRGDD
jgi:purine catabolism regulator